MPQGLEPPSAMVSTEKSAIRISELSHRYGPTVALDNLSLEIPEGSIFGVLGPNGSGKSTLFRLLSTLVPIQAGQIQICGLDAAEKQQHVREQIGVVFQSPSLDRKLTARENIEFQAALYGISKEQKAARIDELSKALAVQEHLDTKIDKLSGGLRRRVELVKGLLHRPRVLLLDEPSTGLDPLSRLELWKALVGLQKEHSTTVVLTTHLLDEAEKCDRVAILDQGRLLVSDSPEQLRSSTGQMVFSIATPDPKNVVELLSSKYNLKGVSDHGMVRVVMQESAVSPMDLYEGLGSLATSITIGRPSLEDVFIRIAGKSFH
jgi:ABC-2 type transport system ATP-binding protein